jgi:hypothetical protein
MPALQQYRASRAFVSRYHGAPRHRDRLQAYKHSRTAVPLTAASSLAPRKLRGLRPLHNYAPQLKVGSDHIQL